MKLCGSCGVKSGSATHNMKNISSLFPQPIIIGHHQMVCDFFINLRVNWLVKAGGMFKSIDYKKY